MEGRTFKEEKKWSFLGTVFLFDIGTDIFFGLGKLWILRLLEILFLFGFFLSVVEKGEGKEKNAEHH